MSLAASSKVYRRSKLASTAQYEPLELQSGLGLTFGIGFRVRARVRVRVRVNVRVREG